MLPLLFPWILLVLTVIAIILSFWKKWKVVVPLLVLVLILNWWAECIPFRLWPLNDRGGEKDLTVMSFNIDGTKEDFCSKAPKLTQLIKKYAPDIIFVAEVGDANRPVLDSLMTEEYPYSAVPVGYRHCFYSKYPLPEWKQIEREDVWDLGVYQCKAVIGKDTLMLYGCHFSSNNFSADMKYITPDSISSHKDIKQYISDIRHAYSLRGRDSGIVFDELSNTAHPVLVMGDMNDVGGSTTIRTLEKAGLRDAWWEGGCGYGATIHWPLPYRIDHIMYSIEMKLKEIKVVDSEGLSDHDALVARFGSI